MCRHRRRCFASQSSGGGLAQWLAQPASKGHPKQDHVRGTEFTLHHRNRLGELAYAGCLTHPKTTKNLVHKDMVGKRELLAPHGNCSCSVLVIWDAHRDKRRPPRQAKLKVKPCLTKVAEECGQVTLFGKGTGGRTAHAFAAGRSSEVPGCRGWAMCARSMGWAISCGAAFRRSSSFFLWVETCSARCSNDNQADRVTENAPVPRKWAKQVNGRRTLAKLGRRAGSGTKPLRTEEA